MRTERHAGSQHQAVEIGGEQHVAAFAQHEHRNSRSRSWSRIAGRTSGSEAVARQLAVALIRSVFKLPSGASKASVNASAMGTRLTGPSVELAEHGDGRRSVKGSRTRASVAGAPSRRRIPGRAMRSAGMRSRAVLSMLDERSAASAILTPSRHRERYARAGRNQPRRVRPRAVAALAVAALAVSCGQREPRATVSGLNWACGAAALHGQLPRRRGGL